MTDWATDMSALASRWQRVLQSGSGLFNLVDAAHPLRIYMGGNTDGQPTLTIALTDAPPQIPRFASLEIERRVREGGDWLLLFQLQAPSAFPEFVAMCAELITRSGPAESEVEGLALLLTGLDQWRSLFRPLRDDAMSEAQLRGLVAELICIRDVFRPSRSWADLIRGWRGPLGAFQDFQLADGLCIEVKSIHPSSSSVRVSSLDQLQSFDARLLLATVQVERDVEETPGVVSVPGLCLDIERALAGSFDLLDEFRAKVSEVGFVPDNPAYQDFWFRVGKTNFYDVLSTFPRLMRSDVAPEVIRAEYDLLISGLGQFLVPIEEVFATDPSLET